MLTTAPKASTVQITPGTSRAAPSSRDRGEAEGEVEDHQDDQREDDAGRERLERAPLEAQILGRDRASWRGGNRRGFIDAPLAAGWPRDGRSTALEPGAIGLRRAALVHDPAAGEDQPAVGQLQALGQVVGDHEDRASLSRAGGRASSAASARRGGRVR